MTLTFTPDKEQEIAEAAQAWGGTVEEFIYRAIEEAISLQVAIAQANRGEFIEEDEMDRRFAAMMQKT